MYPARVKTLMVKPLLTTCYSPQMSPKRTSVSSVHVICFRLLQAFCTVSDKCIPEFIQFYLRLNFPPLLTQTTAKSSFLSLSLPSKACLSFLRRKFKLCLQASMRKYIQKEKSALRSRESYLLSRALDRTFARRFTLNHRPRGGQMKFSSATNE